MAWLEAASWGSAGVILMALAVLRRHWARLPSLPEEPQLPMAAPSV